MRTNFGTDIAKPCWHCGGTIAEYTVDSEINLISVRCIGCNNPDVFYPRDIPTTAAECSREHRNSRVTGF